MTRPISPQIQLCHCLCVWSQSRLVEKAPSSNVDLIMIFNHFNYRALSLTKLKSFSEKFFLNSLCEWSIADPFNSHFTEGVAAFLLDSLMSNKIEAP